ncbi:MAG: polysaccharide deacetylase family protein [Candidatus Eisenbacteria bacterium]|nr:polysaccharide deacetylase family protein [Candidatus Eisenbacteria bacterium]
MWVVLSISPSGWEDRARWVLRQTLHRIGLGTLRKGPAGEPFLAVVYGDPPSDLPAGTPRVILPRRASPPETYIPGRPERFDLPGGGECLAFPPLLDPGEGEPVLRDRSGRPLAVRSGDRPGEVRFAYDPVAPALFLLSRAEERAGGRDEHDRFRPEESWAVREGLLGEPVTDLLGDAIRSGIEAALAASAAAALRIHPWPEGERFAVAITHDQDLAVRWPRRLARHASSSLLGKGPGRAASIRRFARDLREGAVPPTLYSERIRDAEERRGLCSTFFFLAEKKDRLDVRYDVSSPPFRRFLRSLAERGFAVGLHGGLDSYLSAERLARERAVVSEAADREAVGVRQHYLRLRLPETWIAQAEAGFHYDASLGYPDHPGFRAGTCFPFEPPDWERPLAIPLLGMDRALLRAGVVTPPDWEEWSGPVRRAGGLASVLFHPYAVDPDRGDAGDRAFEGLLDWAASRKGEAWVATLDEAADWWRTRRFVSLLAARREGAETRLRYRFGVPFRALTLTPLPRRSDTRIEEASGGRAEIRVVDGCSAVLLRDFEAGGELVVAVRPRPEGSER